MGIRPTPAARRRPVIIADYTAEGPVGVRPTEPEAETVPAEPLPAKAGIRYDFPAPGPAGVGGHSDGYCLRIPFAAGRMENSYELIKNFLAEQGYAGLPLPADLAELKRFRLPPRLRHQLSLFGEDGYVHNPIKILFPKPAGRRGELILEVYNERRPGHLLLFHRR